MTVLWIIIGIVIGAAVGITLAYTECIITLSPMTVLA